MCILLIVVVVVSLGSCSTRQSVDVHKPNSDERLQAKSPPEAQRSNDPIASGFFNGTPDQAKQAWLSFIKDGRYRIAQPEDFAFPAKAKELQPNDIEMAPKQPYVGGDINGDGIPNDFAAIVVETDVSDVMKYSLVIFTQPSTNTDAYKQHFVFSKRDLSKTLLEWWSGGLAVREYFDDGSYRYCRVRWNESARRYYCKEE